jgi:gluconolactonase
LFCGCSSSNDSDTSGSGGSGGKRAASSGKAGQGGTAGKASTTKAAGAGGGGAGGAAAAAGAGGGAAGSSKYPMLEAGAIGAPVQVTVDVMPALSLAESPVWDPCEQRLLFPDVNASAIYALKDGKVSTIAKDTNNANGMALDLDGSLILAQMGPVPGHLARLDRSGVITVIEPPGSPTLHTPDDVVVRSDGMIYFTDGEFPPVGGLNFSPLPIYSLAPGGSMLVNAAMVAGPNGIELSPDEHTLYVDAYLAGSVMQFAVAADGSLTPGAALATGLSAADSLCLDDAGNLYVGVSGGLQVLRPDGSKVTLIPIATPPGVTNCTFGDDGKTLYITAWSALWRIEGMPIPGLDWVANQDRVKCPSK